MESRVTDRSARFRPVLLTSLAVCAVLYAALGLFVRSAQLPPPQAESLVYYQYARAWVDGHPFRFNFGAEPTTSGAGYLYPLLLAGFIWLGVGEAGLSTAAFMLGVLFHLGTVFLTWLTARRLEPRAAPLAGILAALSGPLLYAVFGQTDISLFVLLSAGVFCAMVHARPVWLAALLVLCVACRVEGLVVSLAALGASVIPRAETNRIWRGGLVAALIGLAASAGFLVLNFQLTGYVLPITLLRTEGKLLLTPLESLLVGFPGKESLGMLLGLTEEPRRLYLLPMIGGGLALWGLMAHRPAGPGGRRLAIGWGGAILITFGALRVLNIQVAAFERDLAWLLPVWLVFAAVGLVRFAQLSSWASAFFIGSCALIGYQAIGGLYFAAELAHDSVIVASNRGFVEQVNRGFPGRRTFGDSGMPGLKFYLPNHEFRNVEGVTSREYPVEVLPVQRIETFRHDPQSRFEFWLFKATHLQRQWFSEFVGSQVDAEMPAFGADHSLALHRADWSSIEDSTRPLDENVREALLGRQQVDRVDVGFPPDEKRARYRRENRIKGTDLAPYSATLGLGGRVVTDVGRYCRGRERMRITVEPGRDLTMVMRTAAFVKLEAHRSDDIYPMGSSMRLGVRLDGEDVGVVEVRFEDPRYFSEVPIEIPGDLIRNSTAEIEISGDYTSFGYWFYQ